MEEKSSVMNKIALVKEEFLKLEQDNLFQMNAIIKQDKVKEEELNKTIKSLMTEITIEKNTNSLIEID